MSDETQVQTPTPTYLESGAGDVLERIQGLRPPVQNFKAALSRNTFLSVLAVLVITLVLWLAVRSGSDLFGNDVHGLEVLIPFGSAFAGVLLYIMGAARSLRSEWRIEVYFGEYVFRVAQAITYTMVVWWAWNAAVENDAASTALTPNILGLFVGMFILRVERAVVALGERFEELLSSILPGAIRLDGPERRRDHVEAQGTVRELGAQWKILRPKISDMGARDRIDQAVETARELGAGRDSDTARKAAAELARLFEDVRAGADGEQWVPLESLLTDT